MLSLCNETIQLINLGECVITIMCDLTVGRTFDCVDHILLCVILESHRMESEGITVVEIVIS